MPSLVSNKPFRVLQIQNFNSHLNVNYMVCKIKQHDEDKLGIFLRVFDYFVEQQEMPKDERSFTREEKYFTGT